MTDLPAGRWRYLLADLHVHTVLSACAEVEMIPPLIVRRARELGLELIGVTDHNAAHNASAVVEAAAGTGLLVLPGMEVQSREEVHLLCLFDAVEDVMAWQEAVWAALPRRENDEGYFGAQFIVDPTGKHLHTEKQMLSVSARLSVEEVVGGVRMLGGIVIPAHVDRPSFSLVSNLGFVPPELDIAGVELSRHADPAEVVRRFPQLAGYGMVVGGDAHRLEEITARTMFKVQDPSVSELELALAGRDGRRVEVHPWKGSDPSQQPEEERYGAGNP